MKNFIKENKLTLLRLLFSVALVVAAVVLKGYSEAASVVLYLLAFALSGCLIVVKALVSLVKDLKVGEKMLMTVAAAGAIAVGEYFEAALIVILFEIGELIEDLAVTSSRNSVETLQSIRPDKARMKSRGNIVDAQKVRIGDVIEVLAGERIPLDGIVVNSVGSVDTSVITGESTPREVRSGNEVLAGCLNLNSVLHIKVTRHFHRSAAQRIIDLSQNALDKKTRNEKFIRRFANIYTPIVILLAIAVAVIPPLFDGFNFMRWIYRACALLAISCPCALVISVPLAYFCSIGYASKKGILIKSSSVLESLEGINTMAFDKTGTLTKAELHVTKVEAEAGFSKIDLLRFICIAEAKSNHPIAKAVEYEAKKLKISFEKGENYKEYAGKGVECDSEFGHIMAGTRAFVDATSGTNAGTVFVSVNGKYVGFVGIGDELKENSKIAFERLRKLRVRKKIILSGDKKTKVDMVAKNLGADGAYSNLLPEDKLDAIEDIIANTPNCKIAYCGDGINDLPSLARADVGIAMGAVGSDAAVAKSDVVIMDDDIIKVPLAIKIARKTKHVVIQNIVFAIAAKVALLVLSTMGIVPLFAAVLGDVGILIISILNSIRAGR
ncbi:MAG: cadmium-translocating P-type ATPase [Ruminococcaceae bacterium]|nr:cadmium-translocating P-type ATPase [Oscillospiraceae bacterium]